MLFITQIKSQKKPLSSTHTFSSNPSRKKSFKFTRQSLEKNQTKSKSLHNQSRRQKTNFQLEKSIEAIKNKDKAKEKWHKIVELFQLSHQGIEKIKNISLMSATTTPKFQSTSTLMRTPMDCTTPVAISKFNRTNSRAMELMKKQKRSEIQKMFLERQNSRRQDTIQKINLFDCLLKTNLPQAKYNFNIPETILDENRSFVLLTNQKGIIVKKSIQKADIFNIFQKYHEQSLKKVKSSVSKEVFEEMYEQLIDTKLNSLTPFVVICTQNEKKNLSMQVESYRNFGQNRWDSIRSSYVQRYIFSRNLKALIMRSVYQRCSRGQQKQQFSVDRFQNYSSIFKVNINGQNDFLDFKAKVSPSYTRQYTLQHIKLTGPGVINRFIQPTTEIRKMIESVFKKRVNKLWVDFAEDISGTLYAIGIKGVQFQQSKHKIQKSLWDVATQVGSCRLCSGVFQKCQLQNSVSVRMLLQFLHHLRRRTRYQQLQNCQFVNLLALNRKQNAMSAVCECCYALIIRQLQLKKYQRVLGKLCNINIHDEGDSSKTEGKELFQWRLMVYLEEIYQETKDMYSEFSKKKIDNVTVRCVLAKGMEEKWKCKVQQKTISIKKVKVHYFFSETTKIQDFLRNTQILVSILSGDKEEVIAQGSTGILANFRNKFVTENGQRQTATVLLFFDSGKYCALTLKVGLVHDGVYRVPQMPMRTAHSVMFPTKDYLNSNPLPKEWMQAFGYDEQIQVKQVKYQDLLKDNSNTNTNTTGLKKKTMRHYW